MKICVGINAQMTPSGNAGGTQQVVIGIIHALGKLTDGEEEYIILTNPSAPEWVKSYMGPNMRIVVRPHSIISDNCKGFLKSLKAVIPQSVKQPWWRIRQQIYQKRLYRKAQSSCRVQSRDGFLESLGLNVIHFPFQSMEVCAIPSVFNPHDLQHLHLPKFFTKKIINWREMWYPTWCRCANAVAVSSEWVKEDLIRQYNINKNKIYIIPFGSPTEAYKFVPSEFLNQVKKNFILPDAFALYPAQTWAHKNHIRLLEAVTLLRDKKSFIVNIICTGRKNSFFPQITKYIHNLRLENQVRFLGFVSPEELRALYRLAQFIIIPTLFEADSFPLIEAWQEGAAVACSNVTSLPKQAGDAALLFNPYSVESIANTLLFMSKDNNIRNDLKRSGAERVKLFTWEKTARMYRALYRKIINHQLSEEDNSLLVNAIDKPIF